MKKKRYMALSAAVLVCLLGCNLAMKPVADKYVAPMVKEQLNKSVNGQVTYDNLSISWNGAVELHNVSLEDSDGREVGQAQEVAVRISPLNATKLLQGEGGAALISDVTVTNGELHVWQKSDQTWNVVSLIKQNDSSASNSFKGDIHLEHMDLKARPYGQELYAVDDINGGLSLADSPQLQGSLEGLVDGHSVSITGTFDTENTDNFTAYIKADYIKATYANALLETNKDIHLEDGYVKNVQMNVASENGKLTWNGHAALRNLAGTYQMADQTYTFNQVESNLIFNQNHIVFQRGSALINGQKGQVSGAITIGADKADLNLDVVAVDVDLAQLINQPIGGTWATSLHIGGDTLHPNVSGRLVGHNVSYNGYQVDSISSNLSYEDNRLALDDIAISQGNSSVKGQAVYHVDSTDFEAQISPQGFDISQIGPMLGYDIGGTISGSLYVNGNNQGIHALVGNLEGDHISYQGVGLDHLSLGLTSNGEETEISYLNGQVGQGTISGHGWMKDDQVDVDLFGHQVPLSMLSNYLGYDLQGKANVEAHVKGPISNPQGHLSVTTGNIDVGTSSHFDNLIFDADIKDQNLTINKATLRDKDGFYTVTGAFGLADKSLDIYADAKDTRIENMSRSFTDFPVTGWFYTQNHITGTLMNPQIEGRARLKDGSIHGFLIGDMYTRYKYQGNTLYVYDTAIESYGSKIMGQGTMVDHTLNFSFMGDGIYLKPLVSNPKVQVDGYVATQGTITGTLENPIFNGYVRSQGITLNGTQLNDIQGTVYADKNAVNVQSMSLGDDDGGSYHFQGGMNINGDHNLFGKVEVKDANIDNLVGLVSDSDLENKITGRLNGTVGLGGTIDNPALDINGTVTDTTFGDQVLGNGTIDASLANKKISIRTLQLPVDTGLIAAGGTMDLNPGGQVDMQLAVNSVDLKYFQAFLPDGTDARGKLSSVINLSGDSNNPKAEMSADLTSASYNGVSLDHVFALATMENQIITIQALMGQKGDYRATVSGKLPLAAIYTSGYLAPTDDKSMNLIVDLSQADLAVLPLMTPAVTSGQGPIAGKVTITGSIDEPQAFGKVVVRDGLLHFKGLAKDLESINADLMFNGNLAQLQGDARMGEGSAGYTGEMTWAGRTLTSYKGALQLDGLELANEYAKGPISAELYATEVNGVPTLTGHVDLENDTFKIPLAMDSSGDVLPFALDVTVKAGKNVRLYDRTLYDMGVTGEVRFAGHTYWPTPSGAFTVTDGTFKYLSHTFRITKGLAQFRQGSYLPTLDLQAMTQTGEHMISLGVKGTIDNLEMHLGSDSGLSQQQIISMLTFGRTSNSNSSSISGDDATAVGISMAQMYAFGYVEDAMKSSLGLDLINITTGSLDSDEPTNRETAGYYNVEIGKYVIPNLMVTYSKGLNNSDSQYGVRYKLGSHTSTRAWHNSDGHTFVGAYWKTTF